MQRKFLVLLFATVLVLAFCLGYLVYGLILSSSEIEDEEFSVPVEVYGFTEKVRVEFYSENGSFELVGIDGVDHSFCADLSFHEADRVNVYLLTRVGIELWSGNIAVSENYRLIISNSSAGVKVDYLEAS
ncbi:MAG: hypothetical protein WC325_12355 [Candidatus Bathyarchaeia archaeon]|jgi:hypothetical protein